MRAHIRRMIGPHHEVEPSYSVPIKHLSVVSLFLVTENVIIWQSSCLCCCRYARMRIANFVNVSSTDDPSAISSACLFFYRRRTIEKLFLGARWPASTSGVSSSHCPVLTLTNCPETSTRNPNGMNTSQVNTSSMECTYSIAAAPQRRVRMVQLQPGSVTNATSIDRGRDIIYIHQPLPPSTQYYARYTSQY